MTVLDRPEVILEGDDKPLGRALDRASDKMDKSGRRMGGVALSLGLTVAAAFAKIAFEAVKAAAAVDKDATAAFARVKESATRSLVSIGNVLLPAVTASANILAASLERVSFLFDRLGSGRNTGAQTDAATQFFGSSNDDLINSVRERMAATNEMMVAQRKANDATRRAGLEAIALTERIAFLNTMIRQLPAPTLEWERNLGKVQTRSLVSIEVTDRLSRAFEENKTKVLALSRALTTAANEQDRLNEAQRIGSGILGGLSSLSGVFGAIPGLGAVSGLFGAFSSFGGLFADGGTIEAGQWGIVGERGPEIVSGPAEVMPMGSGSSSKVVINVPPARDLITMARDQQWTRSMEIGLRTLVDNGFNPAPAR